MTDNADQRPQDDYWWLSPGGEYCPFCEGAMHAEALAYCIGCDRPVCHVCVVDSIDSNDLLCPECATQSNENEDGES